MIIIIYLYYNYILFIYNIYGIYYIIINVRSRIINCFTIYKIAKILNRILTHQKHPAKYNIKTRIELIYQLTYKQDLKKIQNDTILRFQNVPLLILTTI